MQGQYEQPYLSGRAVVSRHGSPLGGGGKPDAGRCAWRQGALSPDQESAEPISADPGRVGEVDIQGGHAWIWPPVHVLPRRVPLRLSALRVPDAGPDDPHSPPYLRQPLHDGGRGHPDPTADPRPLIDHDDHAVCAPIAGAFGLGYEPVPAVSGEALR